MSLTLDDPETQPQGLSCKTFGHGTPRVFVGDYQIAMTDFLVLAEYVLTNTNLQPVDPRPAFLDRCKQATLLPGWSLAVNDPAQRIDMEGTVPATLTPAYLLIDGRPHIPFKNKWRIFTDKELCLSEARKLGFTGMVPLGDTPGHAVCEKGGNTDITVVPVILEVP